MEYKQLEIHLAKEVIEMSLGITLQFAPGGIATRSTSTWSVIKQSPLIDASQGISLCI